MIALREGKKRDIRALVTRVDGGSGTWALTSPLFRILDANRALVSGYDWAAATWDSTTSQIYALFDSTVAALAAPGLYYVQLMGTIGAETYDCEVEVWVVESGP